ncbi:MAG: PQQ-dependent sugar dehydrogenase [Armatimonadetes bacterium]|nr:PQQ-dependent sugar dehydrogenase [Armatimonadota bacterium]
MPAKQFVVSIALAVSAAGASGQSLKATTVVTGLSSPIEIVQDPIRRNVQYIVEQGGVIKVRIDGVVRTMPLIDVSGSIVSGGEQGLLGMAVPAGFANGYFYVNCTRPGPRMQVDRYTVTQGDPYVADPATRRTVIATARTNDNHNGGKIAFGPDGMLYIGIGDGGGSGDPEGNGQNPSTLLGKMVRIDPRTDDFPTDPERSYHVPADNPFVDNDPVVARKEIWSFGLRNPFKFNFDDPNLAGNGALVIGDVGQGAWEELDYEPYVRGAGSSGGANYGWGRFEGFAQFSDRALAYSPDTKPAYVYDHGKGETVIGGRVYRGLQLGPDAFGRYFFADYITRRLWSLRFYFDANVGRWRALDLREHTAEVGSDVIGGIVSIDVDSYGELFLVDLNGKVSSLTRTDSTWIKDLTVQDGKIKSGALRNLIGIDDKDLVLSTKAGLPATSTMTVVGQTNRSSSSFFDFDAVGRLSNGSKGLLRMYARRWTDGAYVQVRAENMDSTQRRFRVTGLPAATYVRASDGRVEIRLGVQVTQSVATSTVAWNQVLMSAR